MQVSFHIQDGIYFYAHILLSKSLRRGGGAPEQVLSPDTTLSVVGKLQPPRKAYCAAPGSPHSTPSRPALRQRSLLPTGMQSKEHSRCQ